VVLVQVVVAVEARRDKLRVVDVSVRVRVDHQKCFFELGLAQTDISSGETLLELLVGELAITVVVHLRESLAQLLDLILGNTRGDQTQSRSLELDLVHISLHVGEDVAADLHICELSLALLGEPRVIVGLLRGQALISLPIEQLRDQILRLRRDVLPHGVRESQITAQHVVDDLLVGFAAKGRLAGEHDVEHDAHGPIIARRRVAALEHLRRDVVGCAIRRIHDLVRAHLLRQAEINQLHM